MSDDELHVALCRHHPVSASSLSYVLDLPRTEVDQGLRRLCTGFRAEAVGTVRIATGRDVLGEFVYEARPL